LTKEEIEARIVELKKLWEHKRSDLDAVGGAIQDCEFWLARIAAAETTEPSPPHLVVAEEDQ